MECALNSYIPNQTFCRKKPKEGQLNTGVIVPPDRLPAASYFDIIQKTEKQNPNRAKTGGGSKMTAGRLSAMMAFGAMMLSCLSLLPFIRRH